MELPEPANPCRKRKTIYLLQTYAVAVDRPFHVKISCRHDHTRKMFLLHQTSNTQCAKSYTC